MPTLSADEVRELAKHARLGLTDEEVENMRHELGAILVHMDALKEVNTEGVEPMTHPLTPELRLRQDKVATSLPVDVALANAPDKAESFFQVPHILSGGE